MNGVDLAVLVVVAFSGMTGFMRGLVREILGLSAWIGAGFAAVWLGPTLLPLFSRAITNPDVADPAAFGSAFLVVLIVLSLIARMLGGAVRKSALGGLDRTLGLVYGLARGAAVVVVLYIGVGTVVPVDDWPGMVLEARSLRSIYLVSSWAASQLPQNYRPALVVPPPGRPTSTADLLHVIPVGRALAALPPIGDRRHEPR